MPIRLSLAAASLIAFAACGQRDPVAPGNEAAATPADAAPAASASAPSPQPQPPRTGPWSATGYALTGARPFWGGSLTGTTIRYMTPEDQFGDVIETRVAYLPDRETYSGAWRGRPFVLTLRRGPCSDGLSDQVYAFSAGLDLAGGSRSGCADPQ
jgi:uncharacterized membrane protein